jgi:hypothetical protein
LNLTCGEELPESDMVQGMALDLGVKQLLISTFSILKISLILIWPPNSV